MTPDLELRMFRFMSMTPQLLGMKDPDRACRVGLRWAMQAFEADSGAVASWDAQRGEPVLRVELPERGGWDVEVLSAHFTRSGPKLPGSMLLAEVTRNDRPWRLLAIQRRSSPFPEGYGKAFARAAAHLGSVVQQIDRQHFLEVRSRIDRKSMERLDPVDLAYHALDSIRTLTGYDHSAALFLWHGTASSLELVAEQIAWSKQKSREIGRVLPVPPEEVDRLTPGIVSGFHLEDAGWVSWTGDWAGWVQDLDYYRARDAQGDPVEPERAILSVPLGDRDGLVGLLKVASRQRHGLGAHAIYVLESFMPHATLALQNARRAERLESRVVSAAKTQAPIDVARGVSHDVNNALGAALPLVQQLRADLSAGRLDTKDLDEDLDQVERSLALSKRIFENLLSLARGASQGGSPGDIARAIRTALALLSGSLEKLGIQVAVDVPSGLETVRAPQADLDQVCLNLIGNARDAMLSGGRLTITVAREGRHAVLTIGDTGTGIPKSLLSRIDQPFVTTKPGGTGLGLSICRSIVTEHGGTLRLESEEGAGTRVIATFPIEGAPS